MRVEHKVNNIRLDNALTTDTSKEVTQDLNAAPAGEVALASKNDEKAFPLALARSGELLRIAAFKTGKGLGKRLGGLGLRKGTVVEVVHHQRNGSVVVSHGSNRVALGGGAAQMIIVTLYDSQAPKE